MSLLCRITPNVPSVGRVKKLNCFSGRGSAASDTSNKEHDMNFLKTALAVAALFAIGATTVVAQTTPAPTKPMTAPAPAAPAMTKAPDAPKPMKEKKAKAPQTEISKACSLQANEKGLKGKPRKAFRKKCMKKVA